MVTPFPPKTPMQMRREAERRANPKPAQPAAKVDPSKYPPLHSETGAEIDATIAWLAHTCPEHVEGSPPAAFPVLSLSKGR